MQCSLWAFTFSQSYCWTGESCFPNEKQEKHFSPFIWASKRLSPSVGPSVLTYILDNTRLRFWEVFSLFLSFLFCLSSSPQMFSPQPNPLRLSRVLSKRGLGMKKRRRKKKRRRRRRRASQVPRSSSRTSTSAQRRRPYGRWGAHCALALICGHYECQNMSSEHFCFPLSPTDVHQMWRGKKLYYLQEER